MPKRRPKQSTLTLPLLLVRYIQILACVITLSLPLAPHVHSATAARPSAGKPRPIPEPIKTPEQIQKEIFEKKQKAEEAQQRAAADAKQRERDEEERKRVDETILSGTKEDFEKLANQSDSKKLNRASVDRLDSKLIETLKTDRSEDHFLAVDENLPNFKIRTTNDERWHPWLKHRGAAKLARLKEKAIDPAKISILNLYRDSAIEEQFFTKVPQEHRSPPGPVLELQNGGIPDLTKATLIQALKPLEHQVLILIGHIPEGTGAFEIIKPNKEVQLLPLKLLKEVTEQLEIGLLPLGCLSGKLGDLGPTGRIRAQDVVLAVENVCQGKPRNVWDLFRILTSSASGMSRPFEIIFNYDLPFEWGTTLKLEVPELRTPEGRAEVRFVISNLSAPPNVSPLQIPEHNGGQVSPPPLSTASKWELRLWPHRLISIPFGMSLFFVGMIVFGTIGKIGGNPSVGGGCIFILLLLLPFVFIDLHEHSGIHWTLDLVGTFFGAWLYLWIGSRILKTVPSAITAALLAAGLGIISIVCVCYLWTDG